MEWISCSKVFPEDRVRVLVCDDFYTEVQQAVFVYDLWKDAKGIVLPGITHWMPMPDSAGGHR
ncbi:MAG TPA: DUF551 domain-containing protein [Phycisphaerales bacterium]|nr:DUF551 domain-containing protein [Phycisphaerales bacterium]